MSTCASWPALVCATVLRAAIVFALPRTVTVTRTSFSSLSPWFWKTTWHVTRAVGGTRLTTGEGWSVLSPTETLVSPWPWRPGAGGWVGAPALAPLRWAADVGGRHAMLP